MKKQESKEYQEAAEILAKKLCVLDSNEWGLLPNFYREDYIFKVRKLLQETYPCGICDSGAVEVYDDATDSPILVECTDCKGTGKGVKVMAVRAKNQPDFKVSIIIPAKNADENDALVTFNGKQAHFVKVVEE